MLELHLKSLSIYFPNISSQSECNAILGITSDSPVGRNPASVRASWSKHMPQGITSIPPFSCVFGLCQFPPLMVTQYRYGPPWGSLTHLLTVAPLHSNVKIDRRSTGQGVTNDLRPTTVAPVEIDEVDRGQPLVFDGRQRTIPPIQTDRRGLEFQTWTL